MMDRLRIGIIGCGGITQMTHLPYLLELDDIYEVVSLCDVDGSMAKDLASHYHIDQVFTDYYQLVEKDLDAVLIASWGSHHPQIMAALKAGKHVFTEKPMCFTPREAEEIDEAVHRSGRKVMVGYMKRYDPAYLYGRQLIRKISDLRYIQVNVFQPIDTLYREHFRIRKGNSVIQSGPIDLPEPGSEEEFFKKLTSEGENGRLIAEAIGKVPPDHRVAYFFMLASFVHDLNVLRGIFGDPLDVLSTEIWHSGLCFSTTMVFPPQVRCVASWIYLPYLKNYHQELTCLGSSTRIRLRFPSPYLLNAPTKVLIEEEDDGKLVEKQVTVSYREAFMEELIGFYDWIINGKEVETDHQCAALDIHWLREMALKIRR